jgi:class 3 adenylate cyclase
MTNARRLLRLTKFGLPVEWEEQPFEWVRPRRFGVTRVYSKGPVAEMRVLADLTPLPGGGTRLTYDVSATPRNIVGWAAIPIQIGRISARAFAAAIRRYDESAASGPPPLYLPSEPEFPEGGRARLEALSKKLLQQGANAEILARLVALIEQADDLTLARTRSHALADYWELPRRAVLETLLWATRAGLFDLQWDLLCPLCRGASQSSFLLKEIDTDVHCEACNISFTANFERSVELTFRANPSVRKIQVQEYCVGGPGVTPHIVVQQLLRPGEKRTLGIQLEAGRYRLRCLEQEGGQFLVAGPDGPSSVVLRARIEGWTGDEISLSTNASLKFENGTASEQLFILERMRWSDQATTAAEVTSLQVFRDLFASEALRPGEMVSVGSLTVLFTDIRESTRMYRDIGDATAFGRIMSHFDVLREIIAAEEGAIVKTIGDAVMAVFRRPAAALRAMLRAQEILASVSETQRPLLLRAGLHSGPCIAVTLNDRLDYFGSTVNMAARLEGFSTGGDVIISASVYADPEVSELLDQSSGTLKATRFEMRLKGFDEDSFELWRVARSESAVRRGASS